MNQVLEHRRIDNEDSSAPEAELRPNRLQNQFAATAQ
jgi:hypothetical protein